MTHYAKGLRLRNADGKALPDGAEVGAYGELFIDDATGFVSAATPAAEKVDATPVKVARLLHTTADAAERAATASGQLTVQVPGDYEVYASGDILGGNASVMKVEVFRNGAVVADAAATPGGSIAAHVVAAGTAVRQSWALVGTLPIALGLGAGAEVRQPLGLAVVGGLMVSQVLTLYLTPVVYLYLDKLTRREEAAHVHFDSDPA